MTQNDIIMLESAVEYCNTVNLSSCSDLILYGMLISILGVY